MYVHDLLRVRDSSSSSCTFDTVHAPLSVGDPSIDAERYEGLSRIDRASGGSEDRTVSGSFSRYLLPARKCEGSGIFDVYSMYPRRKKQIVAKGKMPIVIGKTTISSCM